MVKIMSRIFDDRINCMNLYVETTFGAYLDFAESIIMNNNFQRKRVRASKTVYSLLKTDLKKGCVVPPLVLAVMGHGEFDPDTIEGEELLAYIKSHTDKVVILDGLQRTYTLMDADAEMNGLDRAEYEKFLNYKLRLEVYLDINKFGVLYRMLTLNTGQTPMSLRHQIEMLYIDMLNTKVEGIVLVPDTSKGADPSKNEFQFKNVIDGFRSYLNRNELPIDRDELLENIKMLEHMADERIDQDLLDSFLGCYMKIFVALRDVTGDHAVTEDELHGAGLGSATPFGATASKVFSTSQALTGFGAAAGRMKDHGIVTSFEDLYRDLDSLSCQDGMSWFIELLVKLDAIKMTSKKIGNAQRMFFQYFFRELLNKESDSYLDLDAAVENGYKKYYSQVS